MKRLATLLLVAASGTTQAGFENMMNPLAMMAPSPAFGGYGGYGGYGAFNPLSNPLLGVGGLAALGALGGPALQLAPSLLTGSYMQQLTNPYMGGPLAGNPLFRQSSPLPFAMPGYAPAGYATRGYGTQMFTPSVPNMPALPFVTPASANSGFLPYPQASGYPQARSFQSAAPLPFFSAPMAQPAPSPSPAFFPTMQAPMPQTANEPKRPPSPQAASQSLFFLPFAMPAEQKPVQSPVSAPETSASTSPSPAFFPPMMPPPAEQPAPAPQPAAQGWPFPAFVPPTLSPSLPQQEPSAVARSAVADTQTLPAAEVPQVSPPAATTPLDPAAIMQMFLKPLESAK